VRSGFTNTTGTDITVSAYTVIFYNSGGAEAGSQTGVNVPLTVAASNSVTDTEDHEYVAPVPPIRPPASYSPGPRRPRHSGTKAVSLRAFPVAF
jgi:hypothetical protein